MSRLRLRMIPIIVAMAAAAAFAQSARAQDAASFGFSIGDVGLISEQGLSGIAGDRANDAAVTSTSNVAGQNSAVSATQGVSSTSIGVEIVTPQVGGMRVLGAGIVGKRTTGSGIF